MGRPSKSFKSCQLAQTIVGKFGSDEQGIRVRMRASDDVPRFIKKMKDAHQQTAKSTLRFGPATQQPGKDA